MTDLEAKAQEFKRAMTERERASASELLRAYQLSSRRIEARVRELTDRIREARFQGIEVSSGWLYERDRLTNLKREIEIEINRFSHVALLRVAQEQRAALTQATQDTQALIGEVTGEPLAVRFGSLNTNAVGAIADAAGEGSRLSRLFASRGAVVA
ncbi:MAG: hypothetical protein WCD76_10810, partial [Pyrinomonadaceae bacterium]